MWEIGLFDDSNDDGTKPNFSIPSELYVWNGVNDLEWVIDRLSYGQIISLFALLQSDNPLWADYIDAYITRYWVTESVLLNIIGAIRNKKCGMHIHDLWLVLSRPYHSMN